MTSGWWVHDLADQPIVLVSWIFWVIFSITLHELAHGWIAIWQGDDTPIRLRRMTMNPIVHMGWMSLLMFALIGIAWGAMPVNRYNFRWGRRGDMLVSAAGPAMNILLALIALTAMVFWIRFGPDKHPLDENVAEFLSLGGMLNIALAALNLLPIPPLDGSKIVSSLVPRFEELLMRPQAQMVSFFLLMVVFFSGFGDLIFVVAGDVGQAYVHGVLKLMA